MTKYFAALLMFFVVWPSFAADLNGYTAQYECRAGGAYCNVDVASLGVRACDQTIKASTPWSSINWSNNTICIEAGDHTSKGTLTIPSSASGKPGNYKVLRYYRAGDSDDSPWKQSSANQAKLHSLSVEGADFWVVHRLSFPSIDTTANRILLATGTESDFIINRVLVEGMQAGFANAYGGIKTKCCESARVTIQNSVVRNSWGKLDSEPMGITPTDGTNMRVVNNEIYNWSAHPIQVGRNGTPTMPGYVVENNDIYLTSAMHLPDGLARAKSPVSIKASATSTNPGRIIHNRIWGGRNQNARTCCINGDAGTSITFSTSGSTGRTTEYVLVQNNILMESQKGIAILNGPLRNTSFIGNIITGMRKFVPDEGSQGIVTTGGLTGSEIYLNSFIDNEDISIGFSSSATDIDIKCNAFVTGGSRYGSGTASTTEIGHNAYYGTPVLDSSETKKFQMTIRTRTNSSSYSFGAIVRTTPESNCASISNSACYLYKATVAGTSASSAPTPCTTLGCTYQDGGVTWRAIRGPYTFYRKLLTKPEFAILPYARTYADPNDLPSSAGEAYTCPANYATRPARGINDN